MITCTCFFLFPNSRLSVGLKTNSYTMNIVIQTQTKASHCKILACKLWYIILSRFVRMAFLFKELLKYSADDVIYCTLPLYHSNGGIVALSCVFTSASTLVVRRKFSASRFWEECIQYKATVSKTFFQGHWRK